MLDLSARKVYGALAEQCVGGDVKADKVENATSGHLAGLDSNGNLTDSGVSPTEEVTVEGNPVTFDSPFEQDAKSVVVTVKPIQAGSGTPSPENIRPISGIDEVEIEVSDGESEPTTTTIPLPSTLYGGEENLTDGSGDSRFNKIDLNSLGWTHNNQYGYNLFLSSTVSDKALNYNYLCELYNPVEKARDGLLNGEIGTYNSSGSRNIFAIRDDRFDNVPDFRAAITGAHVCYELATPTTLSFDPTDVELLEGTNVVSTNAEKVAVTYGRSLWQDIDKLKTDTEGLGTKAEISAIADSEPNATASQPYAVGGHFYKDGKFCTAIAQIASGATFTKGTNYVEGTIADNMVKQATFSGTTNANGNLQISNNTNIIIIGIKTNQFIFMPFRYSDGTSDNGWWVHVIGDSAEFTVKSNVSVSGTYYYI